MQGSVAIKNLTINVDSPSFGATTGKHGQLGVQAYAPELGCVNGR